MYSRDIIGIERVDKYAIYLRFSNEDVEKSDERLPGRIRVDTDNKGRVVGINLRRFGPVELRILADVCQRANITMDGLVMHYYSIVRGTQHLY